jgi:hypothetical protein
MAAFASPLDHVCGSGSAGGHRLPWWNDEPVKALGGAGVSPRLTTGSNAWVYADDME